MIFVCFQGKPFNITVIQVYAPTSNAEEAEVEWLYEDLYDLLELILKKRCPFHYRGLECKSRKSRNTWSNRQIWPWCTEWSRQKLIELCQENALITANKLFQQQNRRLYTRTSPDGQHKNQIIFFAAKDGEVICSQQEQDWELTVAQIIISLLPNSHLNWRR